MDKKNSVVCTLFEDHYHHGLAILVNSLYKNGYRGAVFAGYKGKLPNWALKAKLNSDLKWNNGLTLCICDGLDINFMPVETNLHLTNYKPDFMLEILKGPAKNANGIVYLDPDIVIKCRWSFFEQWMSYGVALVHEIVSNDMPTNHPIRLKWKEIIHSCDLKINNHIHSYINAGFCGVSIKNLEFLTIWSKMVNIGIENFYSNPLQFVTFDRTYPFYFTDQDALNISAMCANVSLSEVGPESMDFIHGGWIMSHAIGTPKPWKKNYLLHALKGIPPSLADRQFWKYTDGPVKVFNKRYIKFKHIDILISAFITRVYRKN